MIDQGKARVRRAEAAFTLIELMIVVAIIVTVTTLAVRVYSKGRRGELGTAFARQALIRTREARQRSLAQGTVTRLRLAPGRDTSALVVEERPATGRAWVAVSTAAAPHE